MTEFNYDEIELSAGHWKLPNSGAVGHIKEAVEIRNVCSAVKKYLTAFKVPFTYYEDNVNNNQRDNVNYLVGKHNLDVGALVCQIHFNAGGDGSKGIGTEVLYANPDLKPLASKMSKAISDSTGGGLKDRGAKIRDNVGVLTRTKEHAILIEVCFVNSAIDVAIYKRDFEKICKAIATVLAEAYGKKQLQNGELTMSQYNELKKMIDELKKENRELKEIIDGSGLKEPSTTHKLSWAWAKENGITNGDDPRALITRQQVISMIKSYDNVNK